MDNEYPNRPNELISDGMIDVIGSDCNQNQFISNKKVSVRERNQ